MLGWQRASKVIPSCTYGGVMLVVPRLLSDIPSASPRVPSSCAACTATFWFELSLRSCANGLDQRVVLPCIRATSSPAGRRVRKVQVETWTFGKALGCRPPFTAGSILGRPWCVEGPPTFAGYPSRRSVSKANAHVAIGLPSRSTRGVHAAFRNFKNNLSLVKLLFCSDRM